MTAHATAQTSIDAYYAFIAGPKLGQQQKAIIAHLAKHAHRDFTRAELADATGIRLSSICGRVNELRERYVIEEAPRRPCGVTRVNAHPIRLAPAQGEMFR